MNCFVVLLVMLGHTAALHPFGNATTFSSGECVSPATCTPPPHQHLKVMQVRSRQQWGDGGGYCGSLSIQAIAMNFGCYISQSMVRKSAGDGGGHGSPQDGHEILHTNIGHALENLKFTHDDWDFSSIGPPSSTGYFQWMKKMLVEGSPIVWMIMCKGDGHDAYGLGNYDHVEPVWGIYSNHSLNDTTAYPEDVVVHGADYGATASSPGPSLYRSFASLPDTESMDGNCASAQPGPGHNEYYPCVSIDKHQYGFAITGVMEDPGKKSVPLYLDINNYDEPDINHFWTRPTKLTGTVSVTGPLEDGAQYTIYRWDDLQNVPTDSSYADSTYDYKTTFTAAGDTHIFKDPVTFESDGTTYYRCVKD